MGISRKEPEGGIVKLTPIADNEQAAIGVFSRAKAAGQPPYQSPIFTSVASPTRLANSCGSCVPPSRPR